MQIHEGNLLLPISQRPTPFYSFGQTIADTNDFLFFESITALEGKQREKEYINSIPQFLYAPTDDLALLIVPMQALNYRLNNCSSSGFADTLVQLEYAYTKQYKETSTKRATIIGAIQLPTGSAHKNPPTGFGSPSFFFGLTGYRTAINWYCYASPGCYLTTPRNGTKFGNQFLYQVGVGHNLHHFKKWILLLLIEGNGIYSQRDKIDGCINPNSGGNIFYVGPTLFLSNKRFIFKVGIQCPVAQHLYGAQPQNRILAGIRIGIKFTNVN